MLGHAAGTVTSKYVHHLDSVLLAPADRVARAICEFMLEDQLFESGRDTSHQEELLIGGELAPNQI